MQKVCTSAEPALPYMYTHIYYCYTVLTVHLLDPVLIVLGQFVILGYPLVPGIHEGAAHRAVRQPERVAELVGRHGEQACTCKYAKRRWSVSFINA